jgi:hypothetical protein
MLRFIVAPLLYGKRCRFRVMAYLGCAFAAAHTITAGATDEECANGIR